MTYQITTKMLKTTVCLFVATSLVSGCNSATVPTVPTASNLPTVPATTPPVVTPPAITFANTTASPSALAVVFREQGIPVFKTATYDHQTGTLDSGYAAQYTLNDKLRYVASIDYENPTNGNYSDGVVAMSTPTAGMPTTGSATFNGTGDFTASTTGVGNFSQFDTNAVVTANFDTNLVDVTIGVADQLRINNLALSGSSYRSGVGTTATMTGPSIVDVATAAVGGGGEFGGPNAEETAAFFLVSGTGVVHESTAGLTLTASQ
jgi:hypothetical protein